MVFFEVIFLIIPRFICQLCIQKDMYRKFRVKYHGISSLPYFIFDLFVFDNAYRNAKKNNDNYRILRIIHSLMFTNFVMILLLPVITLIWSRNIPILIVIGVLVSWESAFIQAKYRQIKVHKSKS